MEATACAVAVFAGALLVKSRRSFELTGAERETTSELTDTERETLREETTNEGEDSDFDSDDEGDAQAEDLFGASELSPSRARSTESDAPVYRSTESDTLVYRALGSFHDSFRRSGSSLRRLWRRVPAQLIPSGGRHLDCTLRG